MKREKKVHNKNIITNDAFAELLSALLPIGKIKKIGVAVSGGMDSMVLTMLVKKWCDVHAVQLVAFTVDHKLREASTKEAKQVKKWLQFHHVEHHILTRKGKKFDSNIQGKAREIRYQLLADKCRALEINYLCVAHHLEDQAETFLLRLERGSGVDGLAAMQSLQKMKGIVLVRPLLSISKVQLKVYAELNSIAWIEDPSNKDPKYQRVVFRNMLKNIENKEIFINRVCDTAAHMARAKSYITFKLAEDEKHVVNWFPEGYALVTCSSFFSLHEEAILRIFVKILCNVSGNPYKPRFEDICRLYKDVKKDNFKAKTLYGCSIIKIVEKKEEKLLFCREIAAIEKSLPIQIKKPILWDDRFSCVLKKHYDNVFVGALGTKVTMKWIQKHKRKGLMLPKKVLYGLPMLYNLEKVLAVPHIDYYSKEIGTTTFQCTFHTNMVQNENDVEGEI